MGACEVVGGGGGGEVVGGFEITPSSWLRLAVLESRLRLLAMMGGGEVELVGGLELCCGALKCCCCGICCWDPRATVMPGMFMI